MNGKYAPKLTPIRSSPHFAHQLGRTNNSPAMLNQTPRGAKIDPQIYTDTQSKGLSSRIVLYYDRNHREPKPIINRLYNRAGEFPVVHMNQNTAPTHRYRRGSLTIAHSSPQIKIPAPEESLYQSCTRSEILRTGSLMSHPSTLQDAPQLNLTNGDGDTLLAPLDALKEISRKRIHCDHIDGDPNKKQKPEVATAATTSAATVVSTKRQRDTISPNTKSNFGGAQKKRPCTKNNDVLSSLSSSLTIITPKRKKDETRSGHQLSFQSDSQSSVHKHRRHDTVDYNETLVIQPQQKQPHQENVPRKPVETELTTPPPYNSGLVAIQRTPTTPTIPKLTLFNKAYVPIAKRAESPIDSLNTDDDDDDEPKISYVKPKKSIHTTIGTNSSKPPVEKTKLALMLSCLSGDLDDFDTIDAVVSVTPPTPAAPLIQTPVSIAPIETKLPSPIVSVAEPIKSITVSVATTNTIHAMPSISTASALLTSPIKFTSASDTTTETPVLPTTQRKGGFAFSPNKPDSLTPIVPAKPAISTVIVSSAASISPPRFAPSLPEFKFGTNNPTTTTTVSVASPSNSSVASISFGTAPSFGSSLITGISSFTGSPATTSPNVAPVAAPVTPAAAPVTSAAAPVFSFGNATVEPPKTAATTTITPSFGITKPINSPQFSGTITAPAFQSVASVAFGSPSTLLQKPQPPSFGSANSSFSKPTPSFGSNPKATTGFEAPVTTVLSQSNSSSFTFGGGMTTQAKISSFSTTRTDKPLSFGAASTPSSNQSSASPFGVGASSSSSFGAAQTTSPFSGTAAAPSFGGNQFSAAQKPVGFGSGTTSVAPTSLSDSTAKLTPFGNISTAKPIFGTASTANTFGGQQSTAVVPPTSSNGMFGKQQNALIGSFAFGGSSSAAAPTTTASAFSFNGTAAPAVSTPASGGFSFGGIAAPTNISVPATTTSAAFSFGGSAAAQPAAATASTFAFGGATAAATSAASSSFGFNKPTASSGPFSFGGGATATSTAPKPSMSSFNSAQSTTLSFNSAQPVIPSFNSAPSATPSFSFSGNQTSQTVAPSFGGSMSFGGAQQPIGSSSTFAFGGNNSANATNTQNVTPASFSFSAQQTTSSSNNMFGTPATATPSASPAPFAFGGSSSNSDASSGVNGGAFNFSAQPQQSPGGNLFTAGPSNAPKGRVIRQASRRINK